MTGRSTRLHWIHRLYVFTIIYGYILESDSFFVFVVLSSVHVHWRAIDASTHRRTVNARIRIAASSPSVAACLSARTVNTLLWRCQPRRLPIWSLDPQQGKRSNIDIQPIRPQWLCDKRTSTPTVQQQRTLPPSPVDRRERAGRSCLSRHNTIRLHKN